MGRVRLGVALAAAAVLPTGCGSSPGAPPGPATRYVLPLSALPAAGFTTVDAARPVPPANVEEGRRAGALDAAEARYFRTVPDLATADGPVDVTAWAVRFDTQAHALAALDADARDRTTRSGTEAFSAGSLGDAARADQRLATDADGVQVVQITVEWVDRGVLAAVVVRGRAGATSLVDALAVARGQDGRVAGAFAATP